MSAAFLLLIQYFIVLLKKVDSMSGSGASETSSSNGTEEDRSYAHDDHYEEASNLRSRRPHKSSARGELHSLIPDQFFYTSI